VQADIYSSWIDRIPFVVLFGIATSVELFHERLPRGSIRCIHGAQFDVEQTSDTLEKVFQKAVASCEAPLLLGHGMITLLLERQQEHVQSLQAFVSALKVSVIFWFYKACLIMCSTPICVTFMRIL
jgi:origin recognition complex subunit 3